MLKNLLSEPFVYFTLSCICVLLTVNQAAEIKRLKNLNIHYRNIMAYGLCAAPADADAETYYISKEM